MIPTSHVMQEIEMVKYMLPLVTALYFELKDLNLRAAPAQDGAMERHLAQEVGQGAEAEAQGGGAPAQGRGPRRGVRRRRRGRARRHRRGELHAGGDDEGDRGGVRGRASSRRSARRWPRRGATRDQVAAAVNAAVAATDASNVITLTAAAATCMPLITETVLLPFPAMSSATNTPKITLRRQLWS